MLRVHIPDPPGGDFREALAAALPEDVAVTFAEPGRQQIALPPIEPLAQSLYLIHTDAAWAPARNPNRRLGVKVQPLRLRRVSAANATAGSEVDP